MESPEVIHIVRPRLEREKRPMNKQDSISERIKRIAAVCCFSTHFLMHVEYVCVDPSVCETLSVECSS